MPDETDAEVEALVRAEVARAEPGDLHLGRALLRLLDAERDRADAAEAKVAQVIELCVEWEAIDSACWADAQEIRSALADPK